MKIFNGIPELEAFVGYELGVTEWTTITQNMVDRFGDVTGSDDWIHTDTTRAKSGPFGHTIAQGDLILSMTPRMILSLYKLEGDHLVMIYGSDKIRFPSPVLVNSRIRTRATLAAITPRGKDLLLKLNAIIEVEHTDRPALAAEFLHLYKELN